MMKREDGAMRTETLRDLLPGEQPKTNEVTWSPATPIANDDQYRIALAIKKRLRRARRVLGANETRRSRLAIVSRRIATWEAKPRRERR